MTQTTLQSRGRIVGAALYAALLATPAPAAAGEAVAALPQNLQMASLVFGVQAFSHKFCGLEKNAEVAVKLGQQLGVTDELFRPGMPLVKASIEMASYLRDQPRVQACHDMLVKYGPGGRVFPDLVEPPSL